MRLTRILAIAVAALLCASAAAPASAHGYRSHVRFGFYFGAPAYLWHYSHAYYPYPYYQPAPVVVVPAAPTTYVEQQQPRAQVPAGAPSNYWYFCAESNAYYPYVQQCAGAWQRVSPTPPGH